MADFRGYMIGSFASYRLDRGGISVVATTGKVSDASAVEPTVDFGINPCQWNSLPPEGILLWKVRHPVTETEYKRYIDTHGYHFSKELAREAADKMLNADGSKRRWTMEDAKQMFDKCGAKKPDNATWGDIQYLFAMFYSDYFPKVLDCDQKIVKAVLAYLEDPDAPEGTAFVRYLAVRCFVGDTIKWSDMI